MDDAAVVVAAAYEDDERIGRSLIGPFVMLSSRTGARRQELMSLRWGTDGVVIEPVLDADGEPVEGEDGEPMFTGSVHIGRGTTKTDAGERTIAIDPGMAAALHRHRIASGDPADGSWVFPNPPRAKKGGRKSAEPEHVSEDTVKSAFRRLSDVTGIPGLGTHLFRHSVASWAVAADTDHVEVAARLGHSDASFTVRTYAHPDKDRIAREPLALDWGPVHSSAVGGDSGPGADG
jgi:integrase